MSDKIYISWEIFHQDVKNLCKKLRASKKPYNKIVAISRGGFIPSGIIAYELNIRNSSVVNITTYIGDTHIKIEKIDNTEHLGIIDENTLIIDDLVDSGQTLKIMRKTYPNATYVTIYAKDNGKDQVDIYEKSMPDKWLVFPWDIE